MITITRKAYEAIDSDYRGIYHDYWNIHPEWFGRRVVISTCITNNPNETAELWIENVNFKIIDKE